MGHEMAPGEGGSYWSPCVSVDRAYIRAASGTTFGVPGTYSLKENKRFYGFTDFRGKPDRRGRVGRGTGKRNRKRGNRNDGPALAAVPLCSAAGGNLILRSA